MDYSDLDSAQNQALRAYNTFKPDLPNGSDQYRALIQEPISSWLNVLKESNLSDKRSRINAEVTSSIRHNLAYAYYWMGEVEKAEEQTTIALQEYKNSSWPEEISQQIADNKKRRKANQAKTK